MGKRKDTEIDLPCPQLKRQKAGIEHPIPAEGLFDHGSAEDLSLSKTKSVPETRRPRKLHVGKQSPAEAADDDIQTALDAKTTNQVVKSKIEQVLQFYRSPPDRLSALERNGPYVGHVIVTKSAAIAAVMRMRSDYDISDPTLTSLEDIRELLLHTMFRPMGHNPFVEHVVLVLSKRSALDELLQLKVEGYGLTEIGLFAVELELLPRETKDAAANNLFRHMQQVGEQSDSSAENNMGLNDLVARIGFDKTTPLDDQKEVARIGVCPAPLAEI